MSVSVASAQLNADKYISLARADLEEQNHSLAIQRLNFALKTSPYNVEAFFLRAMAKHQLSDYSGAVIDYSHCIRLAPTSAAAYQNRGLSRAKMGDNKNAIEDFDRAIKYDPSNYFIYINKAYSQLQISDYTGAVKSCKRAISMNEYMESGYLFRGIANFEQKNIDIAIIDYSKTIEINPKNDEAYLRRAIAHNENLEFSLAINDCDSAINIDSLSSMGYFVKANIYAEALNYKEAIFNYDKVIAITPNNALAYFNRANVEVRQNEYTKAAYDYRKVTKINPDNILGHFNLALTYHKLKRYDLAIKSYDKTLELYPQMEDAWFNRAFAKKESGDKAGAQSDYVNGNKLKGQNQAKIFNVEEEEILKKHMHLDADFYRPNFNDEENQIAIFTIPIFEIKETDYKKVSNEKLQYNISSLTEYNESNGNVPFFYLSNSRVQGVEISPNERKTALEMVLNKTESNKANRDAIWRAIWLKSSFDYNNSLASYDSLINASPDFALAYFNKASTMFDLLELMLKLEAGTGSFMDFNEDPKAKQLTDVQTMNIQLNIIEKLYLKSIELDPDFYYSWFNVAIVLSEKKEFENAINAYNRVLKINPDFAEAYYNRGLNYLYLENSKKACNDFSKAGELGLRNAYEVMKVYCR